MKNVIPFFVAFLLTSTLYSQMVHNYSPDSSALTLLLTNSRIDSNQNIIKIDLSLARSLKKRKTVTIDIRGEFLTAGPIEIIDEAKVKFFVFGKSYLKKIPSNKPFFVRVIRPFRSFNLKPIMKISSKDFYKKEWILEVDSVDMASVSGKYPN